MRLILTFFLIFNLNSCKTISDTSSKNPLDNINTDCPEDGMCQLELLKNQNLNIRTDEFGSLYPELNEGKFVVLKFQYTKDVIPDVADSSYSELIYLQLDPENLQTDLQNKDLGDVSLLFARLCFCRGQTGYYRISNGHLSIKNLDKNTWQIDLAFSTTAVPQVIHHINQTFQM